jgi:hypothetical protein
VTTAVSVETENPEHSTWLIPECQINTLNSNSKNLRMRHSHSLRFLEFHTEDIHFYVLEITITTVMMMFREQKGDDAKQRVAGEKSTDELEQMWYKVRLLQISERQSLSK